MLRSTALPALRHLHSSTLAARRQHKRNVMACAASDNKEVVAVYVTVSSQSEGVFCTARTELDQRAADHAVADLGVSRQQHTSQCSMCFAPHKHCTCGFSWYNGDCLLWREPRLRCPCRPHRACIDKLAWGPFSEHVVNIPVHTRDVEHSPASNASSMGRLTRPHWQPPMRKLWLPA